MLFATLLAQAPRFPLLDTYIYRLRTGADLSWRAFFELALIGVVVYVVLRFLQGTRGARLMQAVLAIMSGMLLLSIVARLFQLDRILVLYPYFVGGTFLVTLVVFQPELRRGLTLIGERLSRRARTAQSSRVIESLVAMAANLSRRKIGALVAIERRVPVGALRETGVSIDAEISRELLETIFWPGSALHDLGVIIVGTRIAAAGCEFPLAEADPSHRIFGSRHRAALGMSLETDALVLVVSEETGGISLAVRGRLYRDLEADRLREMLAVRLIGHAEDEGVHEPGVEPAAIDAATAIGGGGPAAELAPEEPDVTEPVAEALVRSDAPR
ncbi:MAG: diadenylate cyclase [Phycisphaerales bacterium]|nr:diadenylate cyclase [Phycisphaerales bacterium]